MDINNLASYMTLEPSQLMRAERCVEQGLGMFDRDEELTENYIKEHLAGSTLKYAMHLLDETTTSYMGVQIHNQNGKFSAPTAGVYNSSSRPEIKSKIKEKVLKRNERENKNEEVELEEASMKQARKNVGADTCWKGYKAKGTKTKNGKSVPNCVKEEDIDEAVVGQDREMRKEEVQEYIDFLIIEGYDCSDLTWDDMHEEYQSLDEGLRSAVKRLLGGKKKEEPAKPMSRGDQLRKKYNVGPEKSDTSAKRQILDRTRAKAERDQKEFGGSRYSKSVADKSKAAHERQLKGGYSKYGADDARGRGNKARKRAAALTKEELDQFDEEGSDSLKDRRMERGGVGGNIRYDKAPGKSNTTGKKSSSGMSAFDKVVSSLKSKYGDKSIISKKTIKKESVEELEEKKMSKAAHKKAAKAGKRWQDSDGDGKWYEPGEDVKTEETAELKGKKKGNVIINPEVSKVNENQDPDDSKKMQIQRKQLMINKQKVALQQKATSKKQSTDMHTEENLQEVDVTTRANNFGAEIENTTLKRKKEKKSLKTFKQLSKGE